MNFCYFLLFSYQEIIFSQPSPVKRGFLNIYINVYNHDNKKEMNAPSLFFHIYRASFRTLSRSINTVQL